MARDSYLVALFLGSSPREMDLVGVSTDPDLTRGVARAMLDRPGRSTSPARAAVDAGRREALRQVLDDDTTRH